MEGQEAVEGQGAEAGQQGAAEWEPSQNGAVTVEVEPVEPVQIQVK